MACYKAYNSKVITRLRLYILNFISIFKIADLLNNMCDMYQINNNLILYLKNEKKLYDIS